MEYNQKNRKYSTFQNHKLINNSINFIYFFRSLLFKKYFVNLKNTAWDFYKLNLFFLSFHNL